MTMPSTQPVQASHPLVDGTWLKAFGEVPAQIGRALYRQSMGLAARQLQACADHVGRLAECHGPADFVACQADLARTLTQNGLEEGRALLNELGAQAGAAKPD